MLAIQVGDLLQRYKARIEVHLITARVSITCLFQFKFTPKVFSVLQNREENPAVSWSDNLGCDKGHIFPLQMETFM